MSAPVAPRVGDLYDLRSEGEVERGIPARLALVISVGLDTIEYRSIASGLYQALPARNFTPARRRNLTAWPSMVATLQAVVESLSEDGQPNTRIGYSLSTLRALAVKALEETERTR